MRELESSNSRNYKSLISVATGVSQSSVAPVDSKASPVAAAGVYSKASTVAAAGVYSKASPVGAAGATKAGRLVAPVTAKAGRVASVAAVVVVYTG